MEERAEGSMGRWLYVSDRSRLQIFCSEPGMYLGCQVPYRSDLDHRRRRSAEDPPRGLLSAPSAGEDWRTARSLGVFVRAPRAPEV